MVYRIFAVCGLLSVLFLTASVMAEKADQKYGRWTQWRGPNRTGRSTDTGLLQDWENQQPRLLWMGEGLGSGYASISLDRGRIYTTGDFEDAQAVVAISAADGALLWKQNITDGLPRHSWQGSRCTPTIDGDQLYVVSSDGQILCLSAKDGQILWRKDFKKEWRGRMMSGWGFSESPLVDGDLVLCTPGGADAMVVALDKTSGREIWRSATPKFGGDTDTRGRNLKIGAGYSSIVISHAAGVKQYIQLIGRGVIGIRASDGEFLWGYSDIANATANVSTPIVLGDYVFCSTGYGAGSALLKLVPDGSGVKAEEQYFLAGSKLQNHHGGMIFLDGHIYCGQGHGNGFPICVEMKSGEITWGGKQRGPGKGSAAVTFADGHLVFRYQSGEVALIEATPQSYKLKGVLKPAFQQGKSWAHPVIAGGRLYLREQNKIMCYDLSR